MSTPLPGKPITTKQLTDHIREWLYSNGYNQRTLRVTEGPDSHKHTGMEIVVSPTPGGGLKNEWAIEMLSWQIRVYGPQSRTDRNESSEKAEILAWQVDRYMMLLEQNGAVVNDLRILQSQRFGSPPSALPKDRSGRHSYVTTYVLDVASGL